MTSGSKGDKPQEASQGDASHEGKARTGASLQDGIMVPCHAAGAEQTAGLEAKAV